jgi:predicted  nucleic acid-binding Zn-ribbon protein
MASDDIQTNLRIPANLKDRLTETATANNRSLSAEVVSRLEASFGNTSNPIADLDTFLRLQQDTIQSRVETVDLRIDLVKARLAAIVAKQQKIDQRIATLEKTPDKEMTDEDFAELQATTAESQATLQEMEALGRDIESLAETRRILIADIIGIQDRLTKGRAMMGARIKISGEDIRTEI